MQGITNEKLFTTAHMSKWSFEKNMYNAQYVVVFATKLNRILRDDTVCLRMLVLGYLWSENEDYFFANFGEPPAPCSTQDFVSLVNRIVDLFYLEQYGNLDLEKLKENKLTELADVLFAVLGKLVEIRSELYFGFTQSVEIHREKSIELMTLAIRLCRMIIEQSSSMEDATELLYVFPISKHPVNLINAGEEQMLTTRLGNPAKVEFKIWNIIKTAGQIAAQMCVARNFYYIEKHGSAHEWISADPAAALAIAAEGLEFDPHSYVSQNTVGLALRELKNYSDSFKCLFMAVNSSPNDFDYKVDFIYSYAVAVDLFFANDLNQYREYFAATYQQIVTDLPNSETRTVVDLEIQQNILKTLLTESSKLSDERLRRDSSFASLPPHPNKIKAVEALKKCELALNSLKREAKKEL